VGTQTDKQCLFYNYFQTGTSSDKFGLFCPLENSITTSTIITCVDLYIPDDDGNVFKGSWAGVSTNTGDIIS